MKPEFVTQFRPPEPKGNAKLLKPVLPQMAIKKQPSLSLKKKMKTDDQPLRSKSSADIRNRQFGTENVENRSGNNDAPGRKPSSTSSLFNKTTTTNSGRSSITWKGATVLSPIKPLPTKAPDISEKVDMRYQKLKKSLLGVSSDTDSKKKC